MEELWIIAGPIIVQQVTNLIRSRTSFWGTLNSETKRLVPIALSGVWAGLFAGGTALSSGLDWKGSLQAFGAALLGIVLHELKKGREKRKASESSASKGVF